MSLERFNRVRQFDVLQHPSPASRAFKPFLVVLQGRRLDHYRSRIVAPLVHTGLIALDRQLNPVFELQGLKVAFFPADIANVPLNRLGKPIGSLAGEADMIVNALDIAFSRA